MMVILQSLIPESVQFNTGLSCKLVLLSASKGKQSMSGSQVKDSSSKKTSQNVKIEQEIRPGVIREEE